MAEIPSSPCWKLGSSLGSCWEPLSLGALSTPPRPRWNQRLRNGNQLVCLHMQPLFLLWFFVWFLLQFLVLIVSFVIEVPTIFSLEENIKSLLC